MRERKFLRVVVLCMITLLSTFIVAMPKGMLSAAGSVSGNMVLDFERLYIVLDSDHGSIVELRFKDWGSSDITPVSELDSLRPFSAVASPVDNTYILGGTATVTSRILSETSDAVIVECRNDNGVIVYSFYKKEQYFDVQAMGFKTWQYVLRYESVPEEYATEGSSGPWAEKQVIVTEPWLALRFGNVVVATSWDRTANCADHVTLDDSEGVPLPPEATAKGVDVGDLLGIGSLIPRGFSLRFRWGVYIAGSPWWQPAKSQSQSSRNLIQNPGYEDGLNHWSTSEGNARFMVDTAARSGLSAARGMETSEGSLGRLYQDVTSLVGADGQYRISGWIKTQGVVGMAVIALDYVGTTGWTPGDGYVMEIGYVSGTQDWTYFESRVFTLPTMPDDAVAAWVLFDFNNGKGTAWFDDLSLQEVAKPHTTARITWEYTYTDTGRGTVLRISIEDGYFKFIAPTTTYRARQADRMLVTPQMIFVGHTDREVKLTAFVFLAKDKCVANAEDMRTGTSHQLVDLGGK